MSKKQLIFLVLLCVLCFSASFGVAWLTKPKAVSAAEPNLAKPAADANEFKQVKQGLGESEGISMQRAMSEKQLKLLIQSLRARIAEYDKKEQELGVREQRLDVTRQNLQKDVNELNSLRVQLANEAANLKQKQQQLEDSMIKMSQIEAANVKKTATIYDKMDATSSAKIFISMCTNKQLDDAVKILSFMTEQKAAKVLNEIGTSDPKIAVDLVQALKKLKGSK